LVICLRPWSWRRASTRSARRRFAVSIAGTCCPKASLSRRRSATSRVKSPGGYVLMPGSTHKSGVQYRIAEGSFEAISDAPTWMLEAGLPQPDSEASAHVAYVLTGVPIGSRTRSSAAPRTPPPTPKDGMSWLVSSDGGASSAQAQMMCAGS
jgi:hypothetical protein